MEAKATEKRFLSLFVISAINVGISMQQVSDWDMFFGASFALLAIIFFKIVWPSFVKEYKEQKLEFKRPKVGYTVVRAKGQKRYKVVRLTQDEEMQPVIEDLTMSDLVQISAAIIGWMDIEQ